MNQITVSSAVLDLAVASIFETYDTNKDGKLSISDLHPLFVTTL